MLVERLDRLAFNPFDTRPKVLEFRVDLLAATLELSALLESAFELLDIILEGVALTFESIPLEFKLGDLLLGCQKLLIVLVGFDGRL